MKKNNVTKVSIIDSALIEEVTSLHQKVVDNSGVPLLYFVLDSDNVYKTSVSITGDIVTDSKSDVGNSNVSLTEVVIPTKTLLDNSITPSKNDKVQMLGAEYIIRNIKYYDQNKYAVNTFDNSMVCSFDMIKKNTIVRNTKL